MTRLFLIPALLLAPVIGTGSVAEVCPTEKAENPEWGQFYFKIEDSRCYVGIAAVNLSVGELKPEDGNLVGYYTIDVPLMRSKNDKGRIVLPLNSTIEELGANGGVLKGTAYSAVDESKESLIVCEVLPEDERSVRLAITTDHRTVKFKSTYTVLEAPAPEEGS